MKRACVLIAGCLVLASCAQSQEQDQNLPSAGSTFFVYSTDDMTSLPAMIPGGEPATAAQLIAWDGILTNIVRSESLGSSDASRLFAAVSVAQHDALELGVGESGVDTAGALVLCSMHPDTCAAMKKMLSKNRYDTAVATLVGDKVTVFLQTQQAQEHAPSPPTGSAGVLQVDTMETPSAGSLGLWLKSDAVTVPPPPAVGTPQDMYELQSARDNAAAVGVTQMQRILYWAGLTVTPPGLWLQETDRELAAHPSLSVTDAARIRAAAATAMADAVTACWNVKYTYWRARPSERGQKVIPKLMVPPSPGYPSDHSMTAWSAATVLSAAFPDAADDITARAQEDSDSRVWAGVEYTYDRDAGIAAGKAIGKNILSDPRFSLSR